MSDVPSLEHELEALREAGLEDFLARFTQAYCHALLWADTWSDETFTENVWAEWWQDPGADWAVRAFDDESRARITEDCEDFVRSQWDDLRGLSPEQCGHDFLLTRNRHGAGFWDRGLGERGDRLTAASHPYGNTSAFCAPSDNLAHLLEG